jgi:hypothetical protein
MREVTWCVLPGSHTRKEESIPWSDWGYICPIRGIVKHYGAVVGINALAHNADIAKVDQRGHLNRNLRF